MKYLILFIALNSIFVSCSDDSVSAANQTSSSRFVPSLGTKVFFDYYKTYDTISVNNELIGQGGYYCVDKIEEIDSKSALVCNFYTPFGQIFNTEMFSFDSLENSVFMHSSFISTVAESICNTIGVDSLPIKLDRKWFKLADYTRNEWVISEHSFTDFPLFSGFISGNCVINAKKGNIDSLFLNNKVYKTTTFVLEAKIDGVLYDSSNFVSNEPISMTMSNEIVLADGIGKIKNTMSPIKASLYYYQGIIPGSLMIPTGLNTK